MGCLLGTGSRSSVLVLGVFGLGGLCDQHYRLKRYKEVVGVSGLLRFLPTGLRFSVFSREGTSTVDRVVTEEPIRNRLRYQGKS